MEMVSLHNILHVLNIQIQMHNDPLKEYLKSFDRPDTLKYHKVEKNCQLREYITKILKADFKRGRTYYKFKNDIENILEGKAILLQDHYDDEKWFEFKVKPEDLAAEGLTLYGKGIFSSNFGKRYNMFIQSFGSGTRHLPGGSGILYNHDTQVSTASILV